ncbi:unnamed protein product [Tuber aestivum]|uniref:Uncharacterized protein n=1 Tax=Tuber aestivum TaxID=59557 RepID=A0A292PZD7_9PEZI|nr:unnamed protein product [Tuber aestivum]
MNCSSVGSGGATSASSSSSSGSVAFLRFEFVVAFFLAFGLGRYLASRFDIISSMRLFDLFWMRFLSPLISSSAASAFLAFLPFNFLDPLSAAPASSTCPFSTSSALAFPLLNNSSWMPSSFAYASASRLSASALVLRRFLEALFSWSLRSPGMRL